MEIYRRPRLGNRVQAVIRIVEGFDLGPPRLYLGSMIGGTFKPSEADTQLALSRKDNMWAEGETMEEATIVARRCEVIYRLGH